MNKIRLSISCGQKIALLGAIFMLLGGTFAYNHYFAGNKPDMVLEHSTPKPVSWDKTTAVFTQELKNEELGLWQELKSAFGVDLSSIRRTSVLKHAQTMRQANPQSPTEKRMVNLVHEVANEYQVPTDKIEICLVATNNGSPAHSNELNQVIIEMNLFPELPEPVQKFIIAHELYHILNNDFQEMRQLNRALKNGTLNAVKKELFARYERFQEKRADICAALKGYPWAERYLAFAHEGIKRASKDPGTTHPTYKDRAHFAQAMLDHARGVQTA